MKTKLLAGAFSACAVLALSACMPATSTGAPSPNQPCPPAVVECHVVNCIVTPSAPPCPHDHGHHGDGVHIEICPPYCGHGRRS